MADSCAEVKCVLCQHLLRQAAKNVPLNEDCYSPDVMTYDSRRTELRATLR